MGSILVCNVHVLGGVGWCVVCELFPAHKQILSSIATAKVAGNYGGKCM